MRRLRPSLVASIVAITCSGIAHAEDRVPVRVASLPGTLSSSATPASLKTDLSDLIEDGTLESLTGEQAQHFQIDMLKRVINKLGQVSGYTAEMTKQERLGGDLSGAQEISLKVRHANADLGIPASVYMKWRSGDRGREAIFVDGQNNGKMLVHAGGWKARILPVLTLDPNGAIAMSEARHPINEAGLKFLAQQWLQYRLTDLELTGMSFEVIRSDFDGNECLKFTAIYAERSQHADYRKCELWIDTERLIPLASVNYTWSVEDATDEQTLVERYEYREIEMNAGLEDVDFDRTNRRYSFKK